MKKYTKNIDIVSGDIVHKKVDMFLNKIGKIVIEPKYNDVFGSICKKSRKNSKIHIIPVYYGYNSKKKIGEVELNRSYNHIDLHISITIDNTEVLKRNNTDTVLDIYNVIIDTIKYGVKIS